jgi:hypothetical protein
MGEQDIKRGAVIAAQERRDVLPLALKLSPLWPAGLIGPGVVRLQLADEL